MRLIPLQDIKIFRAPTLLLWEDKQNTIVYKPKDSLQEIKLARSGSWTVYSLKL